MSSGLKTVVIHSGGLDSTTLLYHLRAEGHEVKALTIDYSQRHAKEIECAQWLCTEIGVEHRLVELPGLVSILGDNALTNANIEVPTGEYRDATIQVTTVPNRNMIMLSVAIGWAASMGFNGVAFGAHAGDQTTYPDCKPPFADAMDAAARVCDWHPVSVYSPFIDWHKGQIVARGLELGVPFDKTWSCYTGRERQCGQCCTCVDRIEAFRYTGTEDPLPSVTLSDQKSMMATPPDTDVGQIPSRSVRTL